MKKGLIAILLIFIVVEVTFSQRWKLKRYEAIAGIGVANVFGDIGGASERETLMGIKDYRVKYTRPGLYLGLRYRITQEQSVKLNLTNAIGAGNDLSSFNEPRGYSYSTFLFEPSVQYEYYFLSEDRNTRSSAMFSHRGMVNTFSMISFYGFVGIGGVLFVPKMSYEVLQSPTQERVDNSAGFSPVIPIGIGIKYVISSEISLNFEIGRRITFTDYIDGLNTNFSHANDVYYFGTFSVIYKLQTSRKGVPLLFQGTRARKSGARPSSGRRPLGL